MLLWKRGFVFVSTGNETLWIHYRLRKIRFDKERPPYKSPMETDDPGDLMFQSTSIALLHLETPQGYWLK